MQLLIPILVSDEDKKKYAMAQASQKAAGGAYMTRTPTDQIVELAEGEMSRAGFRESVGNLCGHGDQPGHSRSSSFTSGVHGPLPGSISPVEGALMVPQATHIGHQRRNGQSPLARPSLSSTASDNGNEIDVAQQPLPYHEPKSDQVN